MASRIIKTSLLVNKVLPQNMVMQTHVELKTLLRELKEDPETFVVEIGKSPKSIFNQSVWAGNRMGGMSTWLNAMMYQLPYKRFYLFVDAGVNEETLDYFDGFYTRAFYKSYMGLCVGERKKIPSTLLHQVKAITANGLFETFEKKDKTFVIDVRSPDQVKKLPVAKLPRNAHYLNIALDNDDLTEKLQESLRNFDPKNHQIVTMCARGYRGTIAYSLFRHLLKVPSLNMKVCQSTTEEINKVLCPDAPSKLEENEEIEQIVPQN